MVTTVVLVAVVALVLGASIGWLERSRRCRAAHAHLVDAYDEGDLETFLGDTPQPEPDDRPEGHELPDPVVPGAFPGSAVPGPGGASPAPGFVVKAKASSRIYHTTSSPSYSRTRAEIWFRCPEEAEAAGFRAPRTQRQGSAPPS